MSYSLVDMVLKSPITDPTEAAVLIALASFSDKYCSCYPSTQALCERSRYKERAVQGAVKRLTDRGILSVKIGRGRGGANFYTIHPAALKPASSAGIEDTKTSSRCAISKQENPHLTTIKPASDDKKPAADADEYTNEPVKNQAVREAEPDRSMSSDRIQSMRDSIVAALGLTGREMNTSGTFVVAGMDPHNVEAALMVWAGQKLTDDQIIAAIRSKIATERGKDPAFMPRGIRFFDGPIADFAKRLAGGAGQSGPQPAPAKPLADPKAEAERLSLVSELDRMRGSNSDAAFNRRRDIVARLQHLQTAAGL